MNVPSELSDYPLAGSPKIVVESKFVDNMARTSLSGSTDNENYLAHLHQANLAQYKSPSTFVTILDTVGSS